MYPGRTTAPGGPNMYNPQEQQFGGYPYLPGGPQMMLPPDAYMYGQYPPDFNPMMMMPQDQEIQEEQFIRKKSMCGPISQDERQSFVQRRSLRAEADNNNNNNYDDNDNNNINFTRAPSAGALSRTGSIYSKGSRRGSSLTRGVSGRDLIRESHTSEHEGREELKEYYGAMAGRQERYEYRGAKAVGSHRDVDGKNVAKPRRTVGRSKAGYGGVTNHREVVMRNGGKWGNMEKDVHVRRLSREESSHDLDMGMPMEIPMPMEEPPEPVHLLSQIDMSVYDDGNIFMNSHGGK